MIGICGAGAFGTALAAAYAIAGQPVLLWGRSQETLADISQRRELRTYLPGLRLPAGIEVTSDVADLAECSVILLSLPMRALPQFLTDHGAALEHLPLISCAKGIDPERLKGPAALIQERCPMATVGVLTGPSFASDIVAGKPTALCLAVADAAQAAALQARLSTRTLRIYRVSDVIGAELGGALKNVIAIACGAAMGAGLGESARASLLTRGFAEMLLIAKALGAEAETLSGLSGLGDLTLTAMSETSRNYRYGFSLGQGDPSVGAKTVEGIATARALLRLAEARGLDVPISEAVVSLIERTKTVQTAMSHLLSRPLKEE